MIRDDRDFESLIWELDRTARASPSRYRTRVALLAAVGYAYVFGLLFVLIALLFGALLFGRWTALGGAPVGTWAIAIVVVVSVWLTYLIRTMVDALMYDIPPPEGSELRRDVAPALFKLIDELSAKLRVPPFDHVMLSKEFNASIRQYSRFGLVGKSVNYLWIGIPLLKALTPDQLRAVLAHELGHISGNHNRFRSWIYHLADAWDTLLNNLRGESKLVRPFLRWYAPYFRAYTFVLRRSNEYDADKCSAEAAGAAVAASTLAAVSTRGRFLDEKFWPSITERAHQVDRPDFQPFSSMFREPMLPTRNDQEKWYREALDHRSGIADTHPCLTERLEALGFRGIPAGKNISWQPPIPLPEFPLESAADHYLGKWLEKYTALLDEEWAHKISGVWQREHEQGQIARDELVELRAAYAAGTLAEKSRGRYARLTHEVLGADAGIALLREYTETWPNSPEYHYGLGVWLLEQGDEAGVASLRQAAALDARRNVTVAREIAAFYIDQGDAEKAAPFEQYVRQNGTYETDARPRVMLKRTDRFVYHSLAPDVIARVREHLRNFPHVGAAYLVQRQQREHPQRPLYVIVIEPQTAYLQSTSFFDSDRLAYDTSRGLDLPGDLSLEYAHGQMKWLKKAVAEMRSARII